MILNWFDEVKCCRRWKEFTLPARESILVIGVCDKMVSEPQFQTLRPNGPAYTQVSCVFTELLFMKMVCIRVYHATPKIKEVKL